ncbi:hypothetical protein IAQ67_16455 [Paenibacillus peoriae]|uniref:Uncharacterized protein n=1 Tax=Paenibacillus peoriae TaxID=59893 RepID=A0A7H0Y320_9BACL|nr:hypothetical protein [Paenibacillus peoriae]QNR65478.1 hypothetical protein IAQ67_16455 [Paenibacillus peoriae]
MDSYMIVVDGKVKEEIETVGRSKEVMSFILIDRYYHYNSHNSEVNIISSLTGEEYAYV